MFSVAVFRFTVTLWAGGHQYMFFWRKKKTKNGIENRKKRYLILWTRQVCRITFFRINSFVSFPLTFGVHSWSLLCIIPFLPLKITLKQFKKMVWQFYEVFNAFIVVEIDGKRRFPAVREKRHIFGQASPNSCHVYLFINNNNLHWLHCTAKKVTWSYVT